MILKLLHFLGTTRSLGYTGFFTKFVRQITLLAATFFDVLILWISIGAGLHGYEGPRGIVTIKNKDELCTMFLFEYLFIRHSSGVSFFSTMSASSLTIFKKEQLRVKVTTRSFEALRGV